MGNARLKGAGELRAARRTCRSLFWAAGLFSSFVNALMLVGPLYMMQVYDRVLGSRSEETLLVLTLLVAFLYGIMACLDLARSRLLVRAGARFQAALDRRVFRAMVRRSAVAQDPAAQTGLSDLESIQRLMGAPVTAAAFDLPWTPIFLAAIALFHPLLGLLALGGGTVLAVIALLNQRLTARPRRTAAVTSHEATLLSEEIRAESGMIQSMGMLGAAFDRWVVARDRALRDGVGASEIGGGFTAATKALRLFLQSAMLGLGAYLALQGAVSSGAMLASSVLLGRALAPIELALGQWQMVQRALAGWTTLSDLLTRVPPEAEPTALPRPEARLEIAGLAIRAPGGERLLLRGLSFAIRPGEALGVIGPSGAGKSSLAQALTGVWTPVAGTIRLGGAALSQYAPDVLGRHIGHLPQRVQMFEGTIAQNIARLSESPDPEAVVAAARKAAAHEMIVNLPEGYDTRVGAGGAGLSGGQMQRIALARALFGDPLVVLLDEPNSSLDAEGSAALNEAIRTLKAEMRAVIVMAHRPAALKECTKLLALDRGTQLAFGSRDQVLAEVTAPHTQSNVRAA